MTAAKGGELVALTDHLVIRIRFKSGAVSEERGCSDQIQALFNSDVEELIDYALGYDPITGQFDMWVHDNDPNWPDEEVERLFGG